MCVVDGGVGRGEGVCVKAGVRSSASMGAAAQFLCTHSSDRLEITQEVVWRSGVGCCSQTVRRVRFQMCLIHTICVLIKYVSTL